ncbi:MAG: dTMP kinase [Chloroflexi bacterium]|nr:dTMP kinase [Chloroflexota bacterium]
MALFITFEGAEGSGKTAQSRNLYKSLHRLAVPVVLTHEPGGTVLGEKVARLLKWSRDTAIAPVAELMLFNASRAELVSEVIRPGLQAGKIVICDRFADSTLAYQGFGRGLDLDMVRSVNETGSLGLKPDLTVLLDIPAAEGLGRKKDKPDRFENEAVTFHERVRDGYLKLAAWEPERWLVVNSGQPEDMVAQVIWQKVREMLPARLSG